jgi:Domain of unknown function (DUF4336)
MTATERREPPCNRTWKYWFTVPIYPFGQRRTLRRELIPGEVWAFEQVQGILYVVTPIRMTVVRLAGSNRAARSAGERSAGGLLVYAPVAPTEECLQLLRELEDQYGAVQYIILPTVSGLEHKVFVGPFARCFPQAVVYVAPHQWSFPLNLPLSWLGLPGNRTHRLPENSQIVPFADEVEYALLGPIDLGPGAFEEVAMFHRRSRTLLVTDAVVSVPEQPPEIIAVEAEALLFHARDHALDVVVDTPANRLKGWQRIALFSFYFRPSATDIAGLVTAFQAATQAPDRSRRNYFGLFPFQWRSDWRQSFDALRGEGRLFVAPILQRLIMNRDPQGVIDWADRVAQWGFDQIVPCHLAAPVVASPPDFRAAFAFLEKQPLRSEAFPLPEADFQLLRELEDGLNRARITPPAREKV